MTYDPDNDDSFIERVANPLRRQERPDATFEARAMSAVHAAARSDATAQARRSWWLRSRTLRMTPLASLALAAGFAGLVVAGSAVLNGVGRAGSAVAEARADTVHVVRFVLIDPSARQVTLVGAFNQWQRGATQLTSTRPGVWTVDVPLHAGLYEYAFVVQSESGERWVADPLGMTVRDEFGTESSVVAVGTQASS